ncbi:helix-turn-helix domain-containing protein [Paenibacillus bouchesdurhonensis]|uniref:helix-turn-helix domain-containing protein n=1 Tax=Paenibacillus bouchesdurhonensis TaxID=1870990 RepID=UPI000DA60CA2|nr:helix-turn-helix transcriptional regulator [Paenibacillus bouchesdurhonensis]
MKNITTLPYLALLHQVSYTSICKEIGITPQQFSDWVKQRRPVPHERLQQVAEYFGVPAELLVDNHHYLLELNGMAKLRLQIAYLTRKINTVDDEEEKTMHRETLAKLQEEIKIQKLQERFNAAIQSGDPKALQLCHLFLDQLEQKNFSRLDNLLALERN